MDVRLKSSATIVAGLLMAASLPVWRASALKIDEPTDFTAVQQNVGEVQGDIESAQCGGWDFGQGVDGKIPTVTGAPGRKGNVMNNGNLIPEVADGGFAQREEHTGALEDGFVFPSSGQATGWSTVCNVNECGNSYPYIRECPAEPPCRNPDECRQMCGDLNAWQRVHQKCTAEWAELNADGNPFQVFDFLEDTGPCMNVDNGDECQPGDANWVDPRTRLQNAHPGANVWCDVDEHLYCCSNAVVNDRDNDPERNCLNCNGDGLPDRNNPGFDFNGEVPANLDKTGCRKGKNAPNGREYVSIYRRYLVSYNRDAVPVVPRDDTTRNDVPVDCYCRYAEFDPKLRRTVAPDYRCVINLEDASKRFKDMKDTQLGKGEYGQNSNLKDPAYDHDAARDTRKDLWVNDFSDTYSLLNGPKIQQSPKDNLFPLLQLDNTDIIVTAQLDQDRPLSDGSMIRATDDSVNTDNPGRRVITEWWQEQQTQAHKLFTASVLRLILPTPASVGLNLSDPFLTPHTSSSSQSSRPVNQQIIDIQIHSSPEDLLSEVSAYLQNGLLLHVREEPVPLVVPLASPVELRALAQGWKRWGEEQEGEAKTKAERAAQKLEDYAERIDQVRALRGELARYIGRLLTYQGTMMRAIGDWLTQNLNTWEQYAALRQQSLDLKPKWEDIQQKYRVFHDRTNMPWCRNDRFTTPIYSFLDDWMPGPPDPRNLKLNIDDPPQNDQESEKLPRLSVEMPPDLVYDFTALRVSTGTVLLPVLTPIQIQLKQSLFDPPAFYEDLGRVSAQLEEISKLPALPPVPTIYQEVLNTLFPTGVIHLSSPSRINPPALPKLPPEIGQTMDRISTILTQMDETYKTFWDSITTYPEQDIPDKKWDCQNLKVMPCIHVEMDLLERFTRIGARPAVQLKEDIQSRGPQRKDVIKDADVTKKLPSMNLVPPTAEPPCPREDWACQVLNVEKTFAREGWRVEGVKEDLGKEDLATLRNRLRKQTIPGNSSSSFPYIITPQDMLPSFNIPAPIWLPVSRFQQSSASS
ncbi:MAG: hypothetical protein PHX87_00395 [Candidatus Peribacteraceae bacterium]|nr:hypothetical protein [Candidatus Peribacteraceae bacterium]MDD5741867.1 hypothetical protein [Candidatus Peribacteraceae bacterium]